MRRTAFLWICCFLLVVVVGIAPAGATRTSANNTSTSYAGYLVGKAPSNAQATTEFTVPPLSCDSNQSGMFLGAYIEVPSNDQHVLVTEVGLDATCQDELPVYSAVYEFAGLGNGACHSRVCSFSPGDLIYVRVQQSPAGASEILKDLTQHENLGPASGAGTVNGQVLIGVTTNADNGSALPIPAFSGLSFMKAKEDKSPPGSAKTKRLNLVSAVGTVLVKTSTLGAKGNDWTESFENS